jgi:ferredoxin
MIHFKNTSAPTFVSSKTIKTNKMKRTIIKIDEEKCNGCGVCVPNCHEGALQIIDGKARLISDLFCDGLGACIGHCPEGAIEMEEREAEPYDEVKVMEQVITQGRNVVVAHLKHLADHNEKAFLQQGLDFLQEQQYELTMEDKIKIGMEHSTEKTSGECHHGGCPGSASHDFRMVSAAPSNVKASVASELRQWPVQLHLLNPSASYFDHADVLLSADCVAFTLGNFHSRLLKDKTLAIACPKLDSNKENYVSKLRSMIEDSQINTLTVAIMEVPCCGGLLQMAQAALQQSSRKIPLKLIEVSIKGEILSEEWI